jgi:adenylosuccinate lyase
MTILQEFTIFEDSINKELGEQLPLLATSKILMECVKAGMSRETAHEIIKKYATTNNASDFFTVLSTEKGFPLTIDQLNDLTKVPADFSGASLKQSRSVSKMIANIIKGDIIKVELKNLR